MPNSLANLASYDTAAYQQLFRYAEDIQLLLNQKKQFEQNNEDRAENGIDDVTGLPPWDLLVAQAERVLAERQKGATSLLLILNVQGLREINNALGYETGDRVLRHLADTLRRTFRTDDLLARLRGDEFAIFSQMDARHAEESIARLLSTPLILDGQEICVGLSVGGTYVSSGHFDFSSALREASIALSFARSNRLSLICMYAKAMESRYSRESVAIDADLWHAAQREELYLLYQPQFAMNDCSRLVGVEALLRWEHPAFGNITPSRFIPIAERNGAMVTIGAWVLMRACQQLQAWNADGLGNVTMAVNVSPRQLRSETFLDVLKIALRETRIAPASLELEIIESEIMSSYDQVKAILEQIRDLGVRIAIDDFGTGHSSLSRLKDLPVSRLKIDRSLICDIETDARAQAVVSCIMDLSSALDIDVVAEGVERRGQLEQFRKHGCHFLQGFLFGRPMQPESFRQETFQN